MDIFEVLTTDMIFSLQVDHKMVIRSTSYNLSFEKSGRQLKGTNFGLFLRELFVNDTFKNTTFCDRFIAKISELYTLKTSFVNEIIVTNDIKESNLIYSFMLGVDLIIGEEELLNVKFASFKSSNSKIQFYNNVFQDMENEFTVFKKLNEIAHFIVDFDVDKNIIYGDSILPTLLNLNPNPENIYNISREKTNSNIHSIIREESFFVKTDLLINGEIEILDDEWLVDNKWVKVEAKILKRDSLGNPKILGGIVYDISNYRDYKDLEYLHTIYELAITSGGIGIFHYNLDKHSNDVFEANIIYANMIGIEPNEDGFYLLSDFTKSIHELEEEISINDNVMKSLENLFVGSIEGTTDDILKIKNQKTGEMKYLLSSSKIDSRYEDGTPKKFGGITIDITDRILKEKNQIRFAYNDELTGLANNRKLMKDMRSAKPGTGLFFDLDDFKKVNDNYGHLFGNKVLRHFAQSLIIVSKRYSNVTPYRLYGDEFFVFCEGKGAEFALQFEKELEKLKVFPNNIVKGELRVEASMGVSTFDDDMNVDEFIKLADYSMYKTKIKKKDRSVINVTKLS